MNEFELIKRYFLYDDANGDDAAVVPFVANEHTVTSVDAFIEGRHFPKNTSAKDIGHKALAVSISDIAAMGAKPTAFLLSLSLPEVDEYWVKDFCRGMLSLANQFKIPLIGGDTTCGPLVISTVVFGSVPQDQILQRSAAKPGDYIYVSGVLGEAGAALNDPTHTQQALNQPTPRVELGMALRGLATSCIDISDGLAQDLKHILTASKVGAKLIAERIPYHTTLKLALTAGDDYELCFTAPKEHHEKVMGLSDQLQLPITHIGETCKTSGLKLIEKNGQTLKLDLDGFNHFS